MRHRLAAAAALLVLVSGCADPDLSADVDDLVAQVRDLPGVTSADAEYTTPVTLDSGKIQLDVAMTKNATAEQVEEVGRVVYDAFRTTHQGEEGDVDVTIGDSTVHLRSFQPEARTDVVVREWGLAHSLAQDGAAAVEIMTQDAPGPQHVETDVVLTLGAGTGVDDVLSTLGRLEDEYSGDDARRGWGVTAADGSSVGVDKGFPGTGTLDAWEALRTAASPASAVGASAVELREYANRDTGPDRFVVGRVTSEGGPADLDDAQVRGPLLEAVRAQVALLDDGDAAWSYRLDVDGSTAVELDPTLCDPASQPAGPLEADLRDERTCPGE